MLIIAISGYLLEVPNSIFSLIDIQILRLVEALADRAGPSEISKPSRVGIADSGEHVLEF